MMVFAIIIVVVIIIPTHYLSKVFPPTIERCVSPTQIQTTASCVTMTILGVGKLWRIQQDGRLCHPIPPPLRSFTAPYSSLDSPPAPNIVYFETKQTFLRTFHAFNTDFTFSLKWMELHPEVEIRWNLRGMFPKHYMWVRVHNCISGLSPKTGRCWLLVSVGSQPPQKPEWSAQRCSLGVDITHGAHDVTAPVTEAKCNTPDSVYFMGMKTQLACRLLLWDAWEWWLLEESAAVIHYW